MGGYLSKPVLRRGDDGLSGKLDLLGKLIHETNDSKSVTKACQLGEQVLRNVWGYQSTSATSQNLLPRGHSNTVSKMSHSTACRGRDLGQWSKGSQQVFERLRDLWSSLSGETFQNWQDMFIIMSERIGEIERTQAMAFQGRTNRLKQLGNSIVPQVAAIPLQRIKDLAPSQALGEL